MDRKKQRLANASRRDFLGSVAVFGGMAAVVAVGGELVTEEPAAAPDPVKPEPKRSYRVTPHIQTYYEKARF